MTTLLFIAIIAAVFTFNPFETDGITLSAEINAATAAELVSLPIHKSDERGAVTFSISNQSQIPRESLRIKMELSSEKMGLLMVAEQRSSTPLTLLAGSTASFSNLNKLLPEGYEGGKPEFNFTYTSHGRRLLERAGEGAVDGDDQFTLLIEVMDGESSQPLISEPFIYRTEFNRENHSISQSEADRTRLELVDLTQSGPLFAWQGGESDRYRLVVADQSARLASAERVLQRFEQPHSPDNIQDREAGILLDVRVNSTQFNVPNQFRQLFSEGGEYIWQVQTVVNTVQGEQIEIYSDLKEFNPCYVISGELKELMVLVFGERKTEQFIENGYLLDQITIDGVEYTKTEVILLLREMAGKINQNKIRVTI